MSLCNSGLASLLDEEETRDVLTSKVYYSIEESIFNHSWSVGFPIQNYKCLSKFPMHGIYRSAKSHVMYMQIHKKYKNTTLKYTAQYKNPCRLFFKNSANWKKKNCNFLKKQGNSLF